MNFRKKLQKKLWILLLVAVMLVPTNIFLLTPTYESNSENKNRTSEMNNEETPKVSQPSVSTFEINETKIYENGTFYLFQEDILFFSLTEPIIEPTESNITITHPEDGDMIIELTQSGSQSEWNATQKFSNSTGVCPAILTYSNGTQTIEFSFYLDINNPAPRVVNVWGRDSEYNDQWTKIAEDGVYETYRDTNFNLTAQILSKEGDIKNVNLSYTDDNVNKISSTFSQSDDSGSLYNYTLDEALEITLDEDNKWNPDTDLYEFVINASDGADSYLFRFYIEILNEAPKITQFDASRTHIPDPSGGEEDIVLTANASDFEDDKLYYDSGEKSAKYTDPASETENKTGCTVIDSSLEDIQKTDGEYYDLEFEEAGEGEFLVQLGVNEEINLDKISSFETNIVIKDTGGTSGDAKAEIYNYESNEWVQLINLTRFEEWITYTNNSDDLSGEARDFYSPDNKSVKIKFYNNYSSDKDVYIDSVNLTTTVERRETFSRVVLNAFGPNTDHTDFESIEQTSVTELINYWNESSGMWEYNLSLSNNPKYYGSWTFQILFMDHGTEDYIEEIWGNFTEGSSSSSDSYNFDISDDNFGKASASLVVSFGIEEEETLNISSAPYTNSSNGMQPMYDETFNLTLDVDGFNNDAGEADHINYTNEEFANRIKIQDNISTSQEYENIFPNYNVSGSLTNTTRDAEDDSDCYTFKLVNRSYYQSVLFEFGAEDTAWINKDNITSIAINLDNWFNTTESLESVYLQFYNFSSEDDEWITPTGGTWQDENLNSTSANQHFSEEILDPTDINAILDGDNNLLMRLVLNTSEPDTEQDYEISIDFVNISVNVQNYYMAKLVLSSSKGDQTVIDLIPYEQDSGTMQYSCELNFEELGLQADNYRLSFIIQNGFSSIWYYGYRKQPKMIKDDYKGIYLYDPDTEYLFRDKNFTLNIRNREIEFSEKVTLDPFLCIVDRDIVSVNGTLDLKEWNDHTYVKKRFEIRRGTESLSDDDRKSFSSFYDENENTWSYEIDLESLDESEKEFYSGGIYFCRVIVKTPFSGDYSTVWKEFRIQNFQPVDFQFDFDDEDSKEFNRGDTYQFDFSFKDYDLEEDIHEDITVRFQIQNKSNEDQKTWIYATYNDYTQDGNTHRYNYEIEFPHDITTGAFNMSYSNWEFLVNDSNSGFQSQISFLNYTETQFIIKNNEPSITGLETSAGADDIEIYRNNEINISFSISDVDEDNPNLLEVIEFNISAPSPTPGVSEDNSSIGWNNETEKREYSYFIERTAELGTYNVSIKVNDTDGRETSKGISFQVLNNRPVIEKVSYNSNDFADNNNNSVYRNIGSSSDIDSVNFSVIVSDVEDSWTDNNHSDTVYIELRHQDEYLDKIENVSPNLGIIRLNLSNIEKGTDANGHNETWVTQYQFNDTINGEKFFAGELDIFVFVNDSDGGESSEVKDKFYVLNHETQKVSVQLEEFDMDEPKPFYFDTEIKEGEDINIYVFITDQEGLSLMKVYMTPLVGTQELGERQISLSFKETDWRFQEIKGTPVYNLTISHDELPDETVKIIMEKIEIFDNDYGYKDDNLYGKTSITIKEFGDNDEIEITGVEVEEGDNVVLWIFTIVGIVALVGVIIAGIYYYRKKTTWKRFLD